uniref:C-type lectin domain-containing protein n=1 Tax=Pygocentrus nattereri TaxID=42514 RepID=A0AAR2JG64_PYGNA
MYLYNVIILNSVAVLCNLLISAQLAGNLDNDNTKKVLSTRDQLLPNGSRVKSSRFLTVEKHSSYVFINDFKSWHDAQSYCRKNHTDLASVRNQAENVKIKEAAKGKTVWIGLFRVFWKWSDQSYSSFRYWKQNQPDIPSGKETCGYIVMTDGGYWSNENCETKFPFICYESELNFGEGSLLHTSLH